MSENKSSWEDYYKDRNCPEYLAYFKKEYGGFIDILLSNGKSFVEAGCGIGTVSKILYDSPNRPCCSGFDINKKMLDIGEPNEIWFGVGDVFDKNTYPTCYLPYVIHSHGVVEHFTKSKVRKIISIQKSTGNPMIHWVPTDAYKEPSFGDEMLLSVEDWLNLLNPRHHRVVGKGLVCVW